MCNYAAQGLPLPFVKKSLQQVRTELQLGEGTMAVLATSHSFHPGVTCHDLPYDCTCEEKDSTESVPKAHNLKANRSYFFWA